MRIDMAECLEYSGDDLPEFQTEHKEHFDHDERHEYICSFIAGFLAGRGWMTYGGVGDTSDMVTAIRGYIDGQVARIQDRDLVQALRDADVPDTSIASYNIDAHVTQAPLYNRIVDAFEGELATSMSPHITDALDLYDEGAFARGDLFYDREAFATITVTPPRIHTPYAPMFVALFARVTGDVYGTLRAKMDPAFREMCPWYPWDLVRITAVPDMIRLPPPAVISQRAEIVAAYTTIRRFGVVPPIARMILLWVFSSVPCAHVGRLHELS